MGIEIVRINSDRDWRVLMEKGYILTLRNDKRNVPMAHVKHKGTKTGIVVSIESLKTVEKKDTDKYVSDSSFVSNDDWWQETWKFNGHSAKKLLTRIVRVN